MSRSKLLATALLVCLPLIAHAHKGWYVGIDAGRAAADAQIKDFLLVGDTTAEDTGSSTGINLRGGYQFGRFFALELGAVDYGDFEYSFNPHDCPSGSDGSCPFSVSTSFRGFTASMVGIVPLGDRWSLNLRAGMSEMQADSRQLSGGDLKQSTREAGLQFGVGVGFKLDEHWKFLFNYSTIEALDFGFGWNLGGTFGVYDLGDTTLASIGANYHW